MQMSGTCPPAVSQGARVPSHCPQGALPPATCSWPVLCPADLLLSPVSFLLPSPQISAHLSLSAARPQALTLLTTSFKPGSKVNTTKTSAREWTHLDSNQSLGSEFSICIHNNRITPHIPPYGERGSKSFQYNIGSWHSAWLPLRTS